MVVTGYTNLPVISTTDPRRSQLAERLRQVTKQMTDKRHVQRPHQ